MFLQTKIESKINSLETSAVTIFFFFFFRKRARFFNNGSSFFKAPPPPQGRRKREREGGGGDLESLSYLVDFYIKFRTGVSTSGRLAGLGIQYTAMCPSSPDAQHSFFSSSSSSSFLGFGPGDPWSRHPKTNTKHAAVGVSLWHYTSPVTLDFFSFFF